MKDSWLSAFTLSRTRVVLVAFASLTTLTIIAQTLWAIAQDRQQTLTAETTNSLVAVRLLEEHASQTLQDAVHTLNRVSALVQASGQTGNRAAVRAMVVKFDLGHSRHLKALQFVTPEGLSWITSPDYPEHATRASNRPHIQYLLTHPQDTDAVIGHPYASPYDSQWVIPVARTMYASNGTALGVVGVDIRLNYFGTLYARVAKENNAAVTLLSDEGFILARSPFEARYVDRDVRESERLATLRNTAVEDSFEDEGFLEDDEGPRLYTYRHLAGFPVTTVYARELDSVLAPWERRTVERLGLAGFTIALLAGLTYFLTLSIKRLRKTQISLREGEAKFATLFRHSPVSNTLVRLDDGRFIDANDYWLNEYGYTLEQVVGRTALELNIWVYPHERTAMIAELQRTGMVDRFEAHHRTRDGRILVGQMSGRIVTVGTEQLIHFTLVDVTRQRQIEQEIRDVNQALEARVQARTEKLEVANHELNQALASLRTMQAEMVRSEKLAALGSLVAGVAHELNTPIGNCVTVGSTLQHQVQELADAFGKGELRRSAMQNFVEQASRGTDILMRALNRASELIGSFKRVAVDRSSDHRRQFMLEPTLREICLTLEPMYKNTPFKLQLDIEHDASMDSYPGALGQVITNFVSNAMQHGFEGRKAGLMRLQVFPEGSEHIRLEFSDDGIGMPDEVQQRVFDPFFTTKLGQGGSGLGMNIVYNIVRDVLGGHITINSGMGLGTCITVVMPITAPQGQSASPDAPLHPAAP
ncbi:MAG: ATP-binding protein [Rhodoferax sp.]